MVNIKDIYKSNLWLNGSLEYREKILNEIEAQNAMIQNRPKRIVVAEDLLNDNINGYYDDAEDYKKHRLVIKKDKLTNPALSVFTVLHEGMHAYQYDVIFEKIPNRAAAAERILEREKTQKKPIEMAKPKQTVKPKDTDNIKVTVSVKSDKGK